MVSAVTRVGLFFKYSLKRQRHLETCINAYSAELKEVGKTPLRKDKIKTMCETRWIESHSTMEDFDDLYPALCNCLDDIACNIGGIWDCKAVTEANGIFHSIAKPCFIAAFKVNHYIFGFTKPLSVLLQGSSTDLIAAYSEIDKVKRILLELRENDEYEFGPLFQSMLDMAEIVHLEGMPVPRICQQQTARSNIEASSPMEYWCRTVFVPFLDHLLQELDNRFSQLAQDAIKVFCLIPSELPRLLESDITTLFERFKDDLPSPSSFNKEIRRWKMLWSNIEHSLSTLVDTLGSNHYVPRSYLNIATIFHVLSVTPVTTASTE